ncbi:hypothetical protein [Streptomyces flavalbus]|uniref:OmpR/PhoB-type domain-containing protein n=1 Tax=Streptomyces flavalbus TaxID=2665155 RepID=A0ABW2VZN9_9ACTN
MTTALPAQATPHDALLADTPRLRPVGDTARRDTQPHTSEPPSDDVVRVDPVRHVAEVDGRAPDLTHPEVDVHIARLRREPGETHRHRAVTVRRVGYAYVPDQQQSSIAAPCGRP